MGLSTKEVKAGGAGFTSKVFGPGNVSAKIFNVALTKPKYDTKGKKAYFVELLLETAPVKDPSFEGFPINSEKPNGPKHKGQTCTIKNGSFPFSDAKLPSGREIKLDDSVMQFIQTICEQVGSTWLHDVNDKYNTIEELFAGFVAAAPYKDVMLDWCIAGDEYRNKNGYISHYCHLAKWEKGFVQFNNPELKPDGNVIPFNEDVHIKKLVEEEVPAFEATEELDVTNDEGFDEFALDDDEAFEL
jgi:hypothetical protein